MSKIAGNARFVGIYVSVDWVDVHFLPGNMPFRTTNTLREIQAKTYRIDVFATAR